MASILHSLLACLGLHFEDSDERQPLLEHSEPLLSSSISPSIKTDPLETQEDQLKEILDTVAPKLISIESQHSFISNTYQNGKLVSKPLLKVIYVEADGPRPAVSFPISDSLREALDKLQQDVQKFEMVPPGPITRTLRLE